MTAITPEELVALAELEKAATAGEWLACRHDDGGCQCGLVWSISLDAVVAHCSVQEDMPSPTLEKRKANAALTAALRNAAPRLLERIAELEAQSDEKDRKLESSRTAYAGERAEKESALAKLRMVSAGIDDVWRWLGDGLDEPGSLSCPIVMSADTLREMVERTNKVVSTNPAKCEIEVWSDGHAHAYSPTSSVRRLEDRVTELEELVGAATELDFGAFKALKYSAGPGWTVWTRTNMNVATCSEDLSMTRDAAIAEARRLAKEGT